MTRYRKPVFILAGASFIFFSLLLLDTLVGLRRGWEIGSKAEWAMIAMMIIFAVFTLAVLLTARRLSDKNVGRIARIVTMLVATIITLALVEGTVRWIPAANVHDAYSKQMNHTRKPNTARSDDGGMVSRNSMGLRGPEMPTSEQAIRIIAIGGSTTESGMVDGFTWTDLAMNRMNEELTEAHRVWIGNAGIAGFSSKHHAHFVEACPWLEQMDYAIIFVGINDAALYLMGKYDEPIQAIVAPHWRRSQLYRHLYLVWSRLRSSVEPTNIDGIGERRRSQRKNGVIVELVPELQPGLVEYRRRIEAIITVCRDRNVEPVFMTQPTLYQQSANKEVEDMLWFGNANRQTNTWLGMPQMREVMQAFNAVLRDTCDSQKVAYIDTQMMDGRVEYFVDDCHFTHEGEEVVADGVCRWFMQNRLHDLPSIRQAVRKIPDVSCCSDVAGLGSVDWICGT